MCFFRPSDEDMYKYPLVGGILGAKIIIFCSDCVFVNGQKHIEKNINRVFNSLYNICSLRQQHISLPIL